MIFSAEFKELKKAVPGSIVQLKSINESQKIDLRPHLIDYIAHEHNLRISQDFREEITQGRNR
jgi:hypothetical protein